MLGTFHRAQWWLVFVHCPDRRQKEISCADVLIHLDMEFFFSSRDKNPSFTTWPENAEQALTELELVCGR